LTGEGDGFFPPLPAVLLIALEAKVEPKVRELHASKSDTRIGFIMVTRIAEKYQMNKIIMS
jgi:hypothetical protein